MAEHFWHYSYDSEGGNWYWYNETAQYSQWEAPELPETEILRLKQVGREYYGIEDEIPAHHPSPSVAASPAFGLQQQLSQSRLEVTDLVSLLQEEKRQAGAAVLAAEEASRARVAALEADLEQAKQEAAQHQKDLIERLLRLPDELAEAGRKAREEEARAASAALQQARQLSDARLELVTSSKRRAEAAEEHLQSALRATEELQSANRALQDEASKLREEASHAHAKAAKAHTQAVSAKEALERTKEDLSEANERIQRLEAALATAREELARAEHNGAVPTAADEATVRSMAAKMASSDETLREQAAQGLRSELEAGVRRSLESQLRLELAEELREEVAAELRGEMEGEVRKSLEESMGAAVRREAEEHGKADAEARALTVARERVQAEMDAAVRSARAEGAAEAAERLEAAGRSSKERHEAELEAARAEAAALARREAEATMDGLRAALAGAEARWKREAALRRKAHNWALELAGNVRVFARIRPVLEVERRQGTDAASVAVSAKSDEEVAVAAEEDAGGAMSAPGAGTRRTRSGRFAFDRVFAPGSSQEEVFDEVEPLVVSCLDGYNATVFAYGQTGSGKTFTIQGEPGNEGVSSRTLARLLSLARERTETERRPFSLELSILEVYNETIRDLLAGPPAGVVVDADDAWRSSWQKGPGSPTPADATASSRPSPLPSSSSSSSPSQPAPSPSGGLLLVTAVGSAGSKLDVNRDPRTGGTFVRGLTRVALRSEADVKEALKQADARRAVGAHNMNEHSSRSHLVLTVYAAAPPLTGRRGGRDLVGVASKLHIIDLAGSERLSKTDASGTRLQEAKAINKSLSALGNVMEALASVSSAASEASARYGAGGSASTKVSARRHIPYRNSKLTALLEDSLRAGSKVLMFVNVSPSRFNVAESSTSLKFASRCRAVQLGRAAKLGTKAG